MENVLKLLYDAIRDNNLGNIETILQSLNLDDNDTSDAYTLFSGLVRICMTYNSKLSLIFLYNYWADNYYVEEEGISLYSTLFMRKEFDVDLLIYINEILNEDSLDKEYIHMLKDKNFTLVEIVESLNILGKDIQVYQVISASEFKWACDKAVKVFGIPTVDNLEYFYNLTKNENGAIADYFAFILRQIGKFAEIPDWVYNPSDGMPVKVSDVTLPMESDIAIPDYEPDTKYQISIEDTVDLILKNSDIVLYDKNTGEEISSLGDGIKESEVKESLIKRLTELNELGKLNMMQEYGYIKQMETLQDDEELFRLLGPVCPITGADLEDMKYGGERMFISNKFVYDDGTEDTDIYITTSWFLGYCEYCNLRLRRKYHAVRQPLIDGGWIGCFCSWQCVKDKASKVDFTDEITPNLCDEFEEELKEFGVYDRVPDNEYITYLTEFYKSKGISGEISILYFYKTGVPCPSCEQFETDKKDLYSYVNPSRILPVDLSINENSQITEIPSFAIYKGDKMVSLIKGYDKKYILDLLKNFNY